MNATDFGYGTNLGRFLEALACPLLQKAGMKRAPEQRWAICPRPLFSSARQPVFNGEQEAKVIALRLGPPPKGFANWTVRLLAEKVVELEIVESVSHETVRRTLKKTAGVNARFSTG